MAHKITLSIANGKEDVQSINENFQKIAYEMNEKILYRKAKEDEDNRMKGDLDMDNHRIYNLPEPKKSHEPIRLKELPKLEAIRDQTEDFYKDSKKEADRAKREADRSTREANDSKKWADKAKDISKDVDKEVALAKDWANKPKGQKVDSKEYSAKHYAEKSKEYLDNLESVQRSVAQVITWHPQVIEENMYIPAYMNAFSAGPTLSVKEGITVQVGEGSFWNIIAQRSNN